MCWSFCLKLFLEEGDYLINHGQAQKSQIFSFRSGFVKQGKKEENQYPPHLKLCPTVHS